MTASLALIEHPATGIAFVDQPEELTTFLQPSCPAAIWRRQSTPDFQSWVDTLDPMRLPQGRVLLRPSAVRSAMAEMCAEVNTPQCPQRDHLIDDVATLAHVFAEVMDAPYLRVRLQAVTSNACRKFHMDAITARLVCTYRGAGTQYGISVDGDDPQRVFSVPTGAPILLRGSQWPETPMSGLLHRSPPIEGTGATRLVLVLDPVFELEDAT